VGSKFKNICYFTNTLYIFKVGSVLSLNISVHLLILAVVEATKTSILNEID
jgi:hypothetical protein